MPNISQQDYIIIDWEGKDASDAAKKAEVDAQLKNLYLANPLSLLSVVFKNYAFEGNDATSPIVSYASSSDALLTMFYDYNDGEIVPLQTLW